MLSPGVPGIPGEQGGHMALPLVPCVYFRGGAVYFKAWFFQGGWFELPFFPRGHRHNPSKKDQYNPRAPSPGVRIVAFLIPKPVYISYYAIEVQSAASHLYHYIHRCEHKITTHSTMAAVCTAGKCLINTTEDRTDHNFHRSAERDFNQYPQLL